MKSDAKGEGTIYYNNPAHKDRTVTFEVHHDGKHHEYRVELPTDTLNALRLDPARGAGEILIPRIRLEDKKGDVLKEWKF